MHQVGGNHFPRHETDDPIGHLGGNAQLLILGSGSISGSIVYSTCLRDVVHVVLWLNKK